MPARRCTACGINYPLRGHNSCDGCGEKTFPIRNASPSVDWKKDAAMIKTLLEKAAEPAASIPTFELTLSKRDGNVFISSLDVCALGFAQQLQPDTLVSVNGVLYEVGGYSYERREYWLLPATERGE